jgi:hypothetical protein
MAKKPIGQPAATSARSFQDSPFIKVVQETNQSPELRKHLIKKLGDLFQAKVISYFTSFNRERAQINDEDAEMLESVLSSEHDGGKLVLVVNSPGGQALAAERIANVCRAYSANNFEVLVPHMAKSAATLICFGASIIHLSKTSELGPVDPQIAYRPDNAGPDDPPTWISAEEYIRSYDKLISSATSGKAKRIEPFLQQLARYDARYIERLRSLQNLSGDISVRLLKSLMMPRKSERAIRDAIDVFLSQTRTRLHGRMINYKEASDCGLKTNLLDLRSEKWQVAWELFVRSDWSVSHNCDKIIETSQSAVYM